MSISTVDRTREALGELRRRFRASSANTLAAFDTLAQQLAATPDSPEVLEALRRELHRVRGTAGSFGFTDASQLAGRLEERALRWAVDPALEREQRATIITHFVGALRMAFADVDATPDGTPIGRRMLLVGVAGEHLPAMNAEALLHGYQLSMLLEPLCTVRTIRASAPHVVVAGIDRAADVGSAAAEANVPLILLDDASRIAGRSGEPTPSAGAIILDVSRGVGAVFDVAERLLLRSGWAGATVLVVDDDPSILAIVRYTVESTEIRVVTLEDPARLHAELEACRPSLLLMDVRFDQHDGIELTRQLRAIPAFRYLPIILFSAAADAATRQAAHEAGADEFLAKPIIAPELRSRIVDRLERRRLQHLAAGLHPATGLALPARAAREAPLAFEGALRGGRPATVILLRAEGPEHQGAAAGDWLRETGRVATALGEATCFVGYSDDMGVLAVLGAGADAATVRLESIASARPDSAPQWRAGVADATDVGTKEFGSVRRAAEESLDAARRGSGSVVSRWHKGQANLAPDVVVVEDDPVLSEMLQYALRATGFSYRVYATGVSALEGLLAMKTQGRRPLVLLDVELPGMDGYSLYEQLRVQRPGSFTVVFMTVHAAEAEQIRTLRSGALDHIAKPLNLRILMAKIPTWIERAGGPG